MGGSSVPAAAARVFLRALQDDRPLTAGQLAQRLPPKQRRFTRSAIRKLMTDAVVIQVGRRYSLAMPEATRRRAASTNETAAGSPPRPNSNPW